MFSISRTLLALWWFCQIIVGTFARRVSTSRCLGRDEFQLAESLRCPDCTHATHPWQCLNLTVRRRGKLQNENQNYQGVAYHMAKGEVPKRLPEFPYAVVDELPLLIPD